MKKIISTFLFVFVLGQIINSQNSEFLQVEKTLNNYIVGSSYNNVSQIQRAFTENATLYLTSKGAFKLFTPIEYANFFKNKTEGELNGRYGTIVSIEIHQDIATAKVEISIPKVKMHYIDLFLLKKFEIGWKIISKTATRIDVERDKTIEINSPVVRLTIINDKNEILMRKTKYGWMTPGQRFYSKQNIREVLNNMAANYNITIKDIKLAGLFTYKYTFKENADTRQFYSAKYKSGAIKSPKDEAVFWLPKEIALKHLDSTVLSLSLMTNQILKYPNTVWGGSFILSKEDGKLQSKIEENFYSLRKE